MFYTCGQAQADPLLLRDDVSGDITFSYVVIICQSIPWRHPAVGEFHYLDDDSQKKSMTWLDGLDEAIQYYDVSVWHFISSIVCFRLPQNQVISSD